MTGNARQRRLRHGYTLIEVTVGLTVTASVLLLSVQLIHRSLRLASNVRLSQNDARSFDDFSRTFREDVLHASELVDYSESYVELRVSSLKSQSPQRVVYSIEEDVVKREASDGDESSTRVVLRFDDDVEVNFVIREDSAAKAASQIVLNVRHRQSLGLETRPLLRRVTATLGLRTAKLTPVEMQP